MTAFPGITGTAEGAEMAAYVEARVCDMACSYPITPSTTMGQYFQYMAANGFRNLWGEKLGFFEPESEHSAASACEGAALTGMRVTNFTAGQGLILMKEVLYTISGKRLPIVFHIGARALTSHSLNIHAGHDDVMGVRDCGWGMLFARNAQEVADLAMIAHRTAEDSATPFMVVQDGFLTTHTVENVLFPEPDFIKEFVGNPRARIENIFDPEKALMVGVVQNQDSYMGGKVAQRAFYDKVLPSLEKNLRLFETLTGRSYGLVQKYQTDDAQLVIVGMGSMMETCSTAADHMRRNGMRAGALTVTSFRPFPTAAIAEALKNAKAIAVVERMDDPLAQSNPLTSELKSALYETGKCPKVISGIAGLGSRDIRPADFIAVYDEMRAKEPRPIFSLNIDHPTALKRGQGIELTDLYIVRGHSIGGYGSVSTNKMLASYLGTAHNVFVYAYSKYGSEKKGLPTTFYLAASNSKVRTRCEFVTADFVVVFDLMAFRYGNPTAGLRQNGVMFMHYPGTDFKSIRQIIPEQIRKTLIERKITVCALDTDAIAKEFSPDPAYVQRLKGMALVGAFLKMNKFIPTDFQSELPVLQKFIANQFGKKGGKLVDANFAIVKKAYETVATVPPEAL